MRRLRARLEFGVELAANEVGMLRELDHLHQPFVGETPEISMPRPLSASRKSLFTS